MNKKILIVSILAVFTLVAISFATAINTTTSVKKKESPLYRIRTRRAIGERLGKIIDYIKTRFLGDRLFFLPFQWLRDKEGSSVRQRIMFKSLVMPSCYTDWCANYNTCKPDCYPTEVTCE